MIFARVPRPGRAKTRLAPALGEEGAAELYRAFLDDTVAAAREVSAARELWVAGAPEDGGVLARRYPDLPVRRQAAGGLGRKLRGAFESAFGRGARRAVAVGSDHPTLPPGHLRRAFTLLDGADVTLGPTGDGGYYAVGLRRVAWPGAAAIFRGIPWSTARVLAATRRAACQAELSAAMLPTWYDIDDPEQLHRLRAEVDPASATGRALRRLDGSAPRGRDGGEEGRGAGSRTAEPPEGRGAREGRGGA